MNLEWKKISCRLQVSHLRIKGTECKQYFKSSNVETNKEIWESNVIQIRLSKANLRLYLFTQSLNAVQRNPKLEEMNWLLITEDVYNVFLITTIFYFISSRNFCWVSTIFWALSMELVHSRNWHGAYIRLGGRWFQTGALINV